jgi:general secretion pathway protein K
MIRIEKKIGPIVSKRLQNERGVAILVTIAIIAVLVALTLELNRQVRSAVVSTATARDYLTLSQMATSGINLAKVLLVKDKYDSDIDSLQEDWADSEKIAALLQELPFEGAKVTIAIADERSKIQVNALVDFPVNRDFVEPQREVWEHFLMLVISQYELTDEVEATTIINAAKDWLDKGDDDAISGLSGAESDYYQELDPPYRCKNGPISHIGELEFVKGMTPELFHGIGLKPGISRYMTVFGLSSFGEAAETFDGKININTADLPVLTAILPVENEDLALAIYEYRQEKSGDEFVHDLNSPNWYKDAPGCGDLDIDPDLITTQSDIFSIEAVAQKEELKVEIDAVVRREKIPESGKWTCKVLSWQVK